MTTTIKCDTICHHIVRAGTRKYRTHARTVRACTRFVRRVYVCSHFDTDTQGLVDGVTGVFTKPYEGARDQGVEGFFKGLGVGAVGLVARPTAGVVDFASGSFDAVKRLSPQF